MLASLEMLVEDLIMVLAIGFNIYGKTCLVLKFTIASMRWKEFSAYREYTCFMVAVVLLSLSAGFLLFSSSTVVPLLLTLIIWAR